MQINTRSRRTERRFSVRRCGRRRKPPPAACRGPWWTRQRARRRRPHGRHRSLIPEHPFHPTARPAPTRGRKVARAQPFLLALLTTGAAARPAFAQQPASSAPAIAPYRAPALVLVQPTQGSSIPQDRPTLVFRFAPGDSSDPIDTRSFAISVDGLERSALFQIASDEAFGALGPVSADSSVALGVHQFAACICTVRGACAEASGSVNVVASAAAPTIPTTNRRRTLLDVILAAAKKLLTP